MLVPDENQADVYMQFIQPHLAHQFAETRDPGIFFGPFAPHRARFAFSVPDHGAEFPESERLSVLAYTLLFVKNRPL